MDASSLVISTSCIAASSPVALAAVRGYRALAAPREVTCPKTATQEVVRIQVARAIAGKLTGSSSLKLRSCTRWPDNKGCGQSCTAQIAGSRNGCRSSRALPSIATRSPRAGRAA